MNLRRTELVGKDLVHDVTRGSPSDLMDIDYRKINFSDRALHILSDRKVTNVKIKSDIQIRHILDLIPHV